MAFIELWYLNICCFYQIWLSCSGSFGLYEWICHLLYVRGCSHCHSWIAVKGLVMQPFGHARVLEWKKKTPKKLKSNLSENLPDQTEVWSFGPRWRIRAVKCWACAPRVCPNRDSPHLKPFSTLYSLYTYLSFQTNLVEMHPYEIKGIEFYVHTFEYF